ncbi:type VI secretion system baseplate subunit TssG [Massilia sp. 9I]|uniref:type VI secretion system baseplate subunit TssG n=1 Tax=Massilia sp. 9I TaxID=2653152 RepID=UPI0012F349A7|nr:type VI secretion system baseplate subunit TssG [Massilia sp. 9I]VXB25553.1 Type VI secretion protein [Massilia sp. 9I]
MIDHLLAEPWRYELFQAIRLLSRWLRRYGVAPESALRFENSLSLAFPASDIDALRLEQGAGGDGAMRLRIRTAVIGLLGVNGALPLHYTERIAAWEHDTRDEGPRAFYDAFSSRQMVLFYRAWCKYRVRGGPDEHNRDRFLAQLAALGGVAGQGQLDAGLAFESLAYFASQLRSRVVPASLIAGVLGEYLEVPVTVEQFAGRWDPLGIGERTRLGENNCDIGLGATLGGRLPRPELGIRIRVGPVSSTVFERFLPGASGARALAALLGRFAIDIPYRELQVVLRGDEVDGASLDGTVRLGLDGFLCTQPDKRDRDDVCYLLD